MYMYIVKVAIHIFFRVECKLHVHVYNSTCMHYEYIHLTEMQVMNSINNIILIVHVLDKSTRT